MCLTLPSNIILPYPTDFEEVEDINSYLVELYFELQKMYSQLAQGINGDIRASAFTQREQWTPILKGATTAGSFTYTHQIGWVLRRGLWVDVWFDISWSAQAGATGNLYVELPYQVAISDQKPFSEALQTSNISYGAGNTVLSINSISNTFRGEIWTSGSGIATSNLAVTTSGQLIGHCRYLGVQDER